MHKEYVKTRLHSSGMRTARTLTVSPSMLCAGGWGVCLLPGGCLLQGGGIPACTETDPPPVNRITDACENITLPYFVAGGNYQI